MRLESDNLARVGSMNRVVPHSEKFRQGTAAADLGAADPEITASAERDPARCDAEGHCITCSDEGIPMRVIATQPALGLALCEDAAGRRTEILSGIIDDVVPGDFVLVHAGAALARIEGWDTLGEMIGHPTNSLRDNELEVIP